MPKAKPTPVDPAQQQQADDLAKLQKDLKATKDLLQRREYELAELVDEIVFANNEAEEATRQRDTLVSTQRDILSCAENFAAYASKLEQDVLLPALGDLHVALQKHHEAASRRAGALQAADRLSPRTGGKPVSGQLARVLDVMRSPSVSAAQTLEQRREALNGAERRAAYETEDAFVVCDALITHQQQLRVLLTDTARRLQHVSKGVSGGAVDAEAAANTESRLTQLEGENAHLKKDVASLNEATALARKERDTLLEKVQQQQPYAALQEQWHAERNQLQQRILALERTVDEHKLDRLGATERFETLQQALEQSQQERALLEEQVRRLRQEQRGSFNGGVVADASDASGRGGGLSSSYGGRQSSLVGARGTQEHELRMELDRLVREHSSHVTDLQAEIATLRNEAQVAKRNKAHDDAQASQLEQLKRNNDTLRRDVSRLQQQLASSGNRGAPDAVNLEARVKTFEDTIQQLNEELNNVDRRIADVEREHAEEKARIVAQFDAERRQYQLERDECDALVAKMSNEMEFLAREAEAYRQGVNASSASATRPNQDRLL